MSEYKKMSLRIWVVFVFVLLLFAYVGYTLYDLQVTQHNEMLIKAQQKYKKYKKIVRKRGLILDHDGNTLVGNKNVLTLAIDTEVVQNPEERKRVADFLAKELPAEAEVNAESLLAKINSGDHEEIDEKTGEKTIKRMRYIVLVKNVDYIQVSDLEGKVNKEKIKGLIFEKTTIRVYPKSEMLSNIIGYTSDNKAVTGIEKTMNNELTAENGSHSYEQSRIGRMISFGETENIDEGRNGMDIYLTVREPIQAIMEEELDRMYKEVNPKAIYAVMVDPYSGDVLAISQRPTYNPGDRSTMTDGSSYNVRVAMDTYEPGSVIKPFVIAMGLDRGYITMDTKIDTGFGPWRYGGAVLRDTHYIGTVTPMQIIQNSSNIGTAMVALRMGEAELYDTLKTFHFGERSGLPLNTEAKGILKQLDKWSKISVTRMCMGHELTVTPLQLVRAYCMLANGGHSVNLRLIDATEDDDMGKRPYKAQTMAQESVFKNPSTHKNLIKMMKTVPRPGGTAELAAVPGYYVAGKTGTANKVENGHYVVDKYFATFCGFVPADNPRFVLLVTCDEPHGDAKYGGSVSGPVFSRIATRTLKYYGIAPEVPMEQWEAEWKKSISDKWKDFNARDKERAERKAAGKSLFAPNMDPPKQPKKKKK